MKRFSFPLCLLLLAALCACSPAQPEQTPPPAPIQSAAPSSQPEADPVQTAPAEESPAPLPEPDPEDPENMTVGDKPTTLTTMAEGTEETVPAIRHTSVLGYAITYDPALFTYGEGQNGETYMAETEPGRPNVYLSIQVVDGYTQDEVVEGLRLQQDIETEAQTFALGKHDYAVTYLRWAEGAGSNDAVVEFFVTEQNGTVFLIEMGNFVDGEEGFGTRMWAMLATLTF